MDPFPVRLDVVIETLFTPIVIFVMVVFDSFNVRNVPTLLDEKSSKS